MAGAANSAKIVLDADAQKVVGEANRGGEAFKRTARAAAGIGAEFDKLPGKLAKSLVGATAILQAIRQTAEQARNMQRELADANRTAGGAKLARGISAARLGLSAEDAEAISTPGAGSTADIDALLSSLATSGKGPGGSGLDRRTVFRAANLARSGAFANDEILKAVNEGRLDDLEGQAGQRIAALDANGELSIRRFENENSEEALALRAARGRGSRVGQSARDARRARQPGATAAQDFIGAVTSPVGGDSIIEAGDTAMVNGGSTALLKRIADNTAPKPALARPPGSD